MQVLPSTLQRKLQIARFARAPDFTWRRQSLGHVLLADHRAGAEILQDGEAEGRESLLRITRHGEGPVGMRDLKPVMHQKMVLGKITRRLTVLRVDCMHLGLGSVA